MRILAYELVLSQETIRVGAQVTTAPNAEGIGVMTVHKAMLGRRYYPVLLDFVGALARLPRPA